MGGTSAACTMAKTTNLLEVRDLVKHFPVRRSWRDWLGREKARVVQAVDGVSLNVAPGETVGLVGESGCGKTTLGRLIVGLTLPTSGTIVFDGEDVTRAGGGEMRRKLRREAQIVFQDPFSSLDPRQSVERIIREPLDIHGIGTRAERTRRVRVLMEQVALPSRYARSLPHELSGGLRQRVGIATALALGPRLIVADEPTSALDTSVQAEIINLLSDLQRSTGVAFLFVSHNLDLVRFLSHRVAVMYLGRIVEVGPGDQVYRQPKHPYTRALLSAVPEPDPRRPLQPVQLTGEVPSPIDVPAGCRFHPRCWMAEEVCRNLDPPLYDFSSAHRAACHVTAAQEGLASTKEGIREASSSR
jgi:oligopeptide/dipeptide ABC transporter ATP-binding protein